MKQEEESLPWESHSEQGIAWDLSVARYHQNHKAIHKLSEAAIDQLNICGTKTPQILREISAISFPVLTKLLVYNNKITNIEALSTLKTPQLARLDISDNLISSLRGLARLDCRNMTALAIDGNLFTELHGLSECNFTRMGVLILNSFESETAVFCRPMMVADSVGFFARFAHSPSVNPELRPAYWTIRMRTSLIRAIRCLQNKIPNLQSTIQMI